jgi:glycosyltransferase involved in cell wall biosynthesis
MPLKIAIDVRRIRDFGIGTYIRNLVRELARLDPENQYLLVFLPEDQAELPGLPENFSRAFYRRPDTHPLSDLGFALFLRQFSPHLTHIPAHRVPLLMPRPYVVTVHDLSSLLYAEGRRWRQSWDLYRFRRGLLRAAATIAVSAATRRDIETMLGIPSDRVRQIYEAPDQRFLQGCPSGGASETTEASLADPQSILERYQVNYPFILYAGTIRPQKNLPRLVEAFAVLRGDLERHPLYQNLRLIIIGDQISKHPSLRRAVIETRVEEVVRFLGFVPVATLRVFYQAAAAFVFPSLYEGFGLPPLEAMACGTPVVASNRSSLPEVVGDAAVLVNPENVFDIARGLREVLLEPERRARLVQRGFQQVRRFSWAETARQVLSIYREVASSRSQ